MKYKGKVVNTWNLKGIDRIVLENPIPGSVVNTWNLKGIDRNLLGLPTSEVVNTLNLKGNIRNRYILNVVITVQLALNKHIK